MTAPDADRQRRAHEAVTHAEADVREIEIELEFAAGTVDGLVELAEEVDPR